MPREQSLEDAIRDDFARASANPYDDLPEEEDDDTLLDDDDEDEDEAPELPF